MEYGKHGLKVSATVSGSWRWRGVLPIASELETPPSRWQPNFVLFIELPLFVQLFELPTFTRLWKYCRAHLLSIYVFNRHAGAKEQDHDLRQIREIQKQCPESISGYCFGQTGFVNIEQLIESMMHRREKIKADRVIICHQGKNPIRHLGKGLSETYSNRFTFSWEEFTTERLCSFLRFLKTKCFFNSMREDTDSLLTESTILQYRYLYRFAIGV